MPNKGVIGRARSAQNAIRHGLTCISLRHPRYRDDIHDVARLMCGSNSNPELFEKAIQVAECDILIREIRSYRDRLIARLLDPYCYPLTQSNEERKFRLAKHEEALAMSDRLMDAAPNENASPEEITAFGQEVDKYFDVVPDRGPADALKIALPDLLRLSRYERRAWSSRKRHFLHFMAINGGYRTADPGFLSKIRKRGKVEKKAPTRV